MNKKQKSFISISAGDWRDVTELLLYLKSRIRTLEGRVTKQYTMINQLRDGKKLLIQVYRRSKK